VTPDIERFTGGHAVGVDVAAIERDLAALWRKASSSAAEHSVTRACAWNLVVYGNEEARLKRANELADALVEVVPSRTIILHHRPNATGPEVEAWVTANCRLMPGGGKLLCTEEITVEARGKGSDHLPSLTRALLVPDIPTAVLWAGLPPHGPLAEELLAVADRVLLDTSPFGAAGLERVEQLGSKATHRVADLAWLREAPLRRALASVFDPPRDASMLYRLKRVDVSCDERSVASAKLLLGWLGARLAWGAPERLDGVKAPKWRVPRQQGSVLVELKLQSDAKGICGMSFEGDKGERVRLTSTAGTFSIEDGVTQTVPLVQHTDEQLVIAALGPRGRDALYHAALKRAVELEGGT